MVAAEPTTLPPYREVKGKELIVRLHPGQQQAYDSKARFILMLAGTQSGKTCFGPDWLLREMRERGTGDYLAVTATFPLLKLKMQTEFLALFQDILHLGTWREADKVFVLRDGSRVIFASATNSESIESATAKAAWLDEAGQMQFKREAWEAIKRRLSLHQGRALLTTTLYGLGWLKTELYDRAVAGDQDIAIVQFDSTVNPAFPRAEYERAQREMPGWKFNLFYRGRYAQPAGLIYDSFHEATCVIPRFPIPGKWPVYVGHDFGAANPAALFTAQDPATGYFYHFHEYKPGPGRSTYEHVEEFKRIVAGHTVLQRVGGSHQEEEIRQGYTAHGWPIREPKLHDVASQIDRVYALHKLNKVFVFRDLVNYLDEKLRYSWRLDEHYQPTDEIEDKASFHLMDSERYMLSDFRPETATGGVLQMRIVRVGA